jgi:catalase
VTENLLRPITSSAADLLFSLTRSQFSILNAENATGALLQNAAVGDFIRDAFGHLKFIGYTEAAMPLFVKAGIADALDEACMQLDGPESTEDFVGACRKLRFWTREKAVSF